MTGLGKFIRVRQEAPLEKEKPFPLEEPQKIPTPAAEMQQGMGL